MKYWALFTLQMMASVGLAVTVLMWVVSQWQPYSLSWTVEVAKLGVCTDSSSVGIGWKPAGGMVGALHFTRMIQLFNEPVIPVPGVRIWSRGWREVLLEADYWLLCPVFFIATVAVHWKRRKPS